MEVIGVGSFGSVGGDAPLPIASMAKMMTAYVILKDHPMAVGTAGFEYTVTAADVADLQARIALDQSVVAVRTEEQLSEYQLLEGLLIPSGDNIAAILARYDAGTVGTFVAKMNAEAAALGMRHTTYTDPSGYLASTVSTAVDQMRLGQAAMELPVFAEIVGKSSATLPFAGLVTNVDTLVGTGGFIGIKTGSDSQADGCLTFANIETVGGRRVTIVGAVLDQGQGSQSIVTAALAAASTLVDSVRPDVTAKLVIPANTRLLTATGTNERSVPVVTATGLSEIGWGGLRVPLVIAVGQPGASVKARQVLGEARVGVSDAGVGVVATSVVPPPSLAWRLRHLL